MIFSTHRDSHNPKIVNKKSQDYPHDHTPSVSRCLSSQVTADVIAFNSSISTLEAPKADLPWEVNRKGYRWDVIKLYIHHIQRN